MNVCSYKKNIQYLDHQKINYPIYPMDWMLTDILMWGN
jgi:hypothetical protein